MALTKIKGQDLHVYLGDVSTRLNTINTGQGGERLRIGLATECTVSLTTNTTDANNKDVPGWRVLVPQFKAADISCTSLQNDWAQQVDPETNATIGKRRTLYDILNNYWLLDKLLFAEFGHENARLVGTYYVTSAELQGQNNQNGTYSLTLQSTGTITYVPNVAG